MKIENPWTEAERLIAVVGEGTDAAKKIKAHYASSFGLPKDDQEILQQLVAFYGRDAIIKAVDAVPEKPERKRAPRSDAGVPRGPRVKKEEPAPEPEALVEEVKPEPVTEPEPAPKRERKTKKQ